MRSATCRPKGWFKLQAVSLNSGNRLQLVACSSNLILRRLFSVYIGYMLTVHLNDLLFFARHGVYEGEAATGGEFEVHLQVSYDEKDLVLNSLDNILDYEALYGLVRVQMDQPTPLLEQLAESILRKIRHEYSFIKEVSITIFKLHPPIAGFQGKVGITLQKKFDTGV
jgi:dihydroneopterin aldolase